MSNSVDNRVVEMQFDNKQFESGVETTLTSLDKLKSSLNLSGAAKGFSELTKAAGSFSLDGIQNEVYKVQQQFTLMGRIVLNTLDRIANTAVSTGTSIVKSLTIDPIKTGLSEYETKMNAVQVIKSNTRNVNTMEDINKALNDLNKYADDTIYNFTQMTDNVGKYVAAGLDVFTAANAVKGMANLAGASGADPTQMARATYQMSQSLGGVLLKIDWNSLKYASMGTMELQNVLKKMAKVENNYDVEAVMKKSGKSFADTLENKWLTGELFTKAMEVYSGTYANNLDKGTLKKLGYDDKTIKDFIELAKEAEDATRSVKTFSAFLDTLKEDAQSGWTQTWEYIIGDFDQAKKLWTDARMIVSGWIAASADARNKTFELWNAMGGREKLFDGIYEAVDSIATVFGKVKKGFTSAFDPITAKVLFDLTSRFNEFTSSVKPSNELLFKIQKSFKGLGAVVHLLISPFAEFITFIPKITEGFGSLAYDVLSVTARFGVYGEVLDEFFEKNKIFHNIIGGLIDIFKSFTAMIPRAVTALSDFTGIKFELPNKDEFSAWLDDIYSKTEPARKAIASFKDTIVDFIDGLFRLAGMHEELNAKEKMKMEDIIGVGEDYGKKIEKTANVFETIGKGIQFFINVVSKIKEGTVTLITKIFDVISGDYESGDGAFGFFESLAKVLIDLGSAVISMAQPILDFFSNFAHSIKDEFSGTPSGNSFFTLLSGGALTAMLWKLKESLDNGVIFEQFTNVAESISDALGGLQNKVNAEAIKSIATAIAILAVSCLIMASIDGDKLASALAGIGALIGEMYGTMMLFEKYSHVMHEQTLASLMTSFIKMAASVLILAIAMKAIADIPSDAMAGARTTIISFIGMYALLIKLNKGAPTDDDGGLQNAVNGLIKFSLAIVVLAYAMKIIGSMDTQDMAKGLFGVIVLVTTVAAFIGYISGVGDKYGKYVTTLKYIAGAMIKFSIAIAILAYAVKALGELDQNTLIQGELALVGIVGILALLVLVGEYMQSIESKIGGSGGASMEKIGAGLIMISIGMVILAKAAKAFGTMDPDQLSQGMLAMASALIAMVVAMNLVPDKGMIGAAFAMILMATAMNLLVGPIKELSSISMDGMIVALTGLVVSMIALTAAASILNQKGIIGAAGSMILLSIAVRILTPALKELGTMNLDQIINMLTALGGVFVILGLAAIVLEPITPVILGLTGAIALLGVGMLALSVGLLVLGPALISAGSGITVFVGELMASIGIIIAGIAGFGVEIVAGIAAIIMAICYAIIEAAPSIVMAIGVTLAALAVGILQYGTIIVAACIELIVKLLQTLNFYLPDLIAQLIILIINIFYGIAKGIDDQKEVILDAIGNLFLSIMNLVLELIESLLSELPFVGGKIKEWCDKTQGDISESLSKDKIENSGEGATQTLSNSLISGKTEVEQAGISVGKAGGDGILSGIKDSLTGGNGFDFASTLKSSFGDGAKDVQDFSYALGVDVPTGYATGIEDNMFQVTDTGELMTNNLFDKMREVADSHSPSVRAMDLGHDIDEGLAIGMEENRTIIDNAIETIFGSLDISVRNLTDDYKLKGMDLMTWFKAGINKNSEGVKNAFDAILNDMSLAVSKQVVKYRIFGKTIIAHFAKGIYDKRGEPKSSLNNVLHGLPVKVREYFSSFKSAGKYLMDGLAAGIRENKHYPVGATVAVAKEAYKAAKNELEVRSPSRKFEYLGMQSDAGYAKGVNKNASLVSDATKDVANDALSAMIVMLASIGGMLDDNLDYSPTITPVLDLSQIQNGANSINGLLTNKTFSLAGRTNSSSMTKFDSMNGILSGIADSQYAGSPDVVAELTSLRDDISKLEDSIMHMQVVLSTGVLVGQIDKGLGINTTRKMRGN